MVVNPQSTVLDGGWGWAVVLAGAIANFLCMGFLRSGGIIYLASVEAFHTTRTKAAWIPMVTAVILFLSAPFGTAIAKRYSYSMVAGVGATIAIAGLICCYFASVVELMFIGWGAVFGLGSSFVLFPSLASVGQYFRKRRPLGTGFVLAGGSIGSICLPPLLEYLMENYGFRGALLIACGFVTHYLISAFLLRLVASYVRNLTNRRLTKKRELKLLNHVDGGKSDEMTVCFISDENNGGQALNSPNSPEDKNPRETRTVYTRLRSALNSIDLSVIQNRTFLVNCIANAFQTGIFLGTMTLLPDYGEDEINVRRIDGAYAVSAASLSDLSIRLFIGWLLARKKLPKGPAMAIVLFVNVLALLTLGLSRHYTLMIICSFVLGACFASGMVLYFEILASCQPPEKYLMAVGFSEMAKALFTVIIASTLGSLKDATGNYTVTFIVFTSLTFAAFLMWLIEIYFSRKQRREKLSSSGTC